MTDLDNAIACLERAIKSNTHDGIQDTDAVYEALEVLNKSQAKVEAPKPRDRALDLELFGLCVELENADGTRTALDPANLRYDGKKGQYSYALDLKIPRIVVTGAAPPTGPARCTCDDHCDGPCPVHYPDPTWNCLTGLDHG